MVEYEEFPLWQDRDIRFDSPEKTFTLRLGEVLIERFQSVEDTKGNNGIPGQLSLSNLRVMWISDKKNSVNLSIGLKCITQIKSRIASSKLKGQTESVYILTKCNKLQFEFIFTNLISDTPKLFSVLIAVQRAYQTSLVYREIRLRSAIIENKSLKILPQEQLYDKIAGVMNLCSSQGTLGTMYITNVRVAWHANTNETFNISIPYIHITSTKLRESKFGLALVLETHKATGGYVLGFRIDPQEKLKATLQEIHNLFRVFSVHPIFGVEYETENLTPSYDDEERATTSLEDESDIINSKSNICSIYFADPNKASDRKPVFSSELGLAIEKLPEGYSLKDLWEVI